MRGEWLLIIDTNNGYQIVGVYDLDSEGQAIREGKEYLEKHDLVLLARVKREIV